MAAETSIVSAAWMGSSGGALHLFFTAEHAESTGQDSAPDLARFSQTNGPICSDPYRSVKIGGPSLLGGLGDLGG